MENPRDEPESGVSTMPPVGVSGWIGGLGAQGLEGSSSADLSYLGECTFFPALRFGNSPSLPSVASGNRTASCDFASPCCIPEAQQHQLLHAASITAGECCPPIPDADSVLAQQSLNSIAFHLA